MPRAQCSSKLRAPSASSRALCRKLWIITGLKTLSSKLPEAPATLMATSLPNTCAQSIVSASHWVGLTLPGMIELPGSFSGMRISPRPQRGPEASQRTSLAIFISDAASVFSAPCAMTIASCAASASNLFGAETNGEPGARRQLGRDARAELGRRVEAGADRGAAERQLAQVRQRRREVRQAVVELRDPARDLLAEGQRRRVLQVGAADLDDVGERRGLRGERVAQGRDRRQQPRRERLDRGDVHRRREDVVRRLAAVDVVVRMDQAPLAERPAEQLRGAVGEHLVHVHVGLRARAGLPDRERELAVVLAGQHLVGGGDDRVGLFRGRACRARG